MRFNARFPWLLDEEHTHIDVRTIVYAGDDISSSGRQHDAVEYEKSNLIFTGIIHHIIEVTPSIGTTKVYIVIILPLVEILPHDKNKLVTEKYEHKRYSCDIGTTGSRDVRIDCVSTSTMQIFSNRTGYA